MLSRSCLMLSSSTASRRLFAKQKNITILRKNITGNIFGGKKFNDNYRTCIRNAFHLQQDVSNCKHFSSVHQEEIYAGVYDENSDNIKTVEEQYSKKTPLEHVLLRPGMYVGPIERAAPTSIWVLNQQSSPMKMIQKEFGTIPALIKIFDEILVNASDNRLRNPDTCTELHVTIDPGSESHDPTIKIYNNGKGIPVQIHRDENMYVPEMLFGHLLTGSNFDDNEKRLTGGRHGYGAKLTNIFSKSFTVDTLDSQSKLRYSQTWTNNMTTANKYTISMVNDDKKDYTEITFVPDMQRLSGDPNCRAITMEDYEVMCRRVVDVAGCAAGELKVTLNGNDVSMNSFAEYCDMYRQQENSPPILYSSISPRWNVGIGLSESSSFESISFVNGMATPRGGTHVNVIVNQVIKKVYDKVARLEPDLIDTVTAGLIRRNVFLACNTLIENPSFDSQMKEFLTSNPNSFGSSYELSEKYLNSLVQPIEDGGVGIVEEVIRQAQGRQQANLLKHMGGKKSKRQLLSIPKLEDAHHAGSSKSSTCTLILTEGDSAKSLAVAGLEVIGREKYGVFPLRGKLLNVRHVSLDQLAQNGEVKALIAILGLDFDREYKTVEQRSDLRYGEIMIMADQDHDGSHIRGLVINFFRHFWPELLQPAEDELGGKSYLSSFVTPILKATKKAKKSRNPKNNTKSFYSITEYNKWRSSLSEKQMKEWTVKYYKGLGTSTPAEAKEYFSEFEKHHRPFLWNSDNDGELLDKVFDKKRAADRRTWLLNEYDADSTIMLDGTNDNSVTYEDFVNKEMIHFSNADNVRSLPNFVDGLKPSQRKVIFACFKRNLKSEIKVAQLSGYCAEHTAYHHGEASLQATIIGMAQDFVGSNNINLLVPSGQFGTRLVGGKDAASPRYIFTHLSPIARYLFPPEDDILLEYLEDDGQMIEPRFYCPIIPLLLVNGASGIGTGWSTYIPPHDPKIVLDYIKAKLDNKSELPSIQPYARGFTGTIGEREGKSGFISMGRARQISKNTILIDELPLGSWTQSYKKRLLELRRKGIISDFVENHTTTKVSFKVTLQPLQMVKMEKAGFEKALGLITYLPVTNMHAFDADSKIRRFKTAESIADAYFPIRLGLYHQRKNMMLSEMEYETQMLRNKADFIQSVTSGKFNLMGGHATKDDAMNTLKDLGFDGMSHLTSLRKKTSPADELSLLFDGQSNESLEAQGKSSDYDYLLNMPLSSLTVERIERLQTDASKRDDDLNELKSQTPEELWKSDLKKLAPHIKSQST